LSARQSAPDSGFRVCTPSSTACGKIEQFRRSKLQSTLSFEGQNASGRALDAAQTPKPETRNPKPGITQRIAATKFLVSRVDKFWLRFGLATSEEEDPNEGFTLRRAPFKRRRGWHPKNQRLRLCRPSDFPVGTPPRETDPITVFLSVRYCDGFLIRLANLARTADRPHDVIIGAAVSQDAATIRVSRSRHIPEQRVVRSSIGGASQHVI